MKHFLLIYVIYFNTGKLDWLPNLCKHTNFIKKDYLTELKLKKKTPRSKSLIKVFH